MASGFRNAVGIEVVARKAFASALDWPGWSRSGKTEEEEALATLERYAPRHHAVIVPAGNGASAVDAVLARHAGVVEVKRWPMRYAIHCMGWHIPDHAWEMEDKDLSSSFGASPASR